MFRKAGMYYAGQVNDRGFDYQMSNQFQEVLCKKDLLQNMLQVRVDRVKGHNGL